MQWEGETSVRPKLLYINYVDFTSYSCSNLSWVTVSWSTCGHFQFQGLQRAAEKMLLSNQKMAKVSLSQKPTFRNAKLLLAVKYKELEKLRGIIQAKQEQLGEFWKILRFFNLAKLRSHFLHVPIVFYSRETQCALCSLVSPEQDQSCRGGVWGKYIINIRCAQMCFH